MKKEITVRVIIVTKYKKYCSPYCPFLDTDDVVDFLGGYCLLFDKDLWYVAGKCLFERCEECLEAERKSRK